MKIVQKERKNPEILEVDERRKRTGGYIKLSADEKKGKRQNVMAVK